MELKWGIIGCGKISNDFVSALSILPISNHKVVAVATANSQERAEAFKTRLGLAYATAHGNYNEVYSNKNVDVIYVGNMHDAHKSTVISALSAGKHVLCEKPMGVNANEVKELVACAKKNNRFLMEGFWSRFWPAYDDFVEELFEKRSIGDVKLVTASLRPHTNDPTTDFEALSEVGGSALLNMGCYTAMIASLAFGDQKPEKIVALGQFNKTKQHDVSGCAILKYTGDRFAEISWSWTTALPSNATLIGSNKKSITLPGFVFPQRLECPDKVYEYQLPEIPEGANFCHYRTQGLCYEAACVRNCIMEGLVECPKMTLGRSILIAEIMDECRRQMGVVFQQD